MEEIKWNARKGRHERTQPHRETMADKLSRDRQTLNIFIERIENYIASESFEWQDVDEQYLAKRESLLLQEAEQALSERIKRARRDG